MKCCCLKLFLLCKIYINMYIFFNEMFILKIIFDWYLFLVVSNIEQTRYFLFLVKLLYKYNI